MDEAYAGARYTPESLHGHVESWFVKANDPSQDRAIWLKWTILAPARAPHVAICETWGIAFSRGGPNVAVKSSFPFSRAKLARTDLDVDVDGTRLDPSGARGAIASGGRRIAFDLAFEVRGGPFFFLPRPWMYQRRFPTSKGSSPIPDARVSGAMTVGGVEWTLDRWPGMVGHNWGRRHAFRYAWAHCNSWDEDTDLVVEGITASTAVGPFDLWPVTAATARLGGTTYAMNGLSSLLRNRGDMTHRRWSIEARGSGATLHGEVWADLADMVGLHYENPDGKMTYCSNTKLAGATFELRAPGGERAVVHSRAAALEIGSRERNHGVRMVG
jgi:hypothetical protein